MNAINPINATNAITTFLSLCNPLCASLSFSPTEEDWAAVTELSQKHGLTPLFSYRLGSLGLSLPEDLKRKWIMAYLYQMGQERKARQQIKELKEILDPEGIPFILLKGTSAMLRLYPDQGLRTFCDIDILIPPERAAHFDLGELIPREEELQKSAIQRVPGGFLNRLSKASELPDLAAKMRFLFHIFFPSRENLHWRYGLSDDKSMRAYYSLHISKITKRFLAGLSQLVIGWSRRLGAFSHKRIDSSTH